MALSESHLEHPAHEVRSQIESYVEHPTHAMPEQVASGFRAVQHAERTERERRDAMMHLSRPTQEEREALAEAAYSAGVLNRGLAEARRSLSQRRSERLLDYKPSEILETPDKVPFLSNFVRYRPIVLSPPVDHTFWWARSDWEVPGHMAAVDRTDGLHFFGGPTQHSGDLFITGFSMRSYYELQANRIPHSPSGLYFSNPHLNLVGGVEGLTGDSDILTGDLWSKCWMHRDQQIFQFGFG